MSNSLPTVGIFTLGCKVNQYESEAIAERFAAEGFAVVDSSEICDFYVINTCTVTAESDRKARQFIRRAIHRNANARILVTGCFSQTQPDAAASLQGVDYICGNSAKLSVVEAAKRFLESDFLPELPIRSVTPPDANGFEAMQITRFDRTRAYVKIEDGCESHCTYCIIPTARGKIRSKRPEDVVREVRTLTEGGCREIVLTGIETASYGKDLNQYGLADLLEEVDRIPGIGRIRLGSLDPSLMKQSFVDRIAKLSSLAPHFHLSLQSGSDRTLARMKRKYNRQMALDGMERLRRAIPDVQFTTDVIAGFPGETDADFAETLDFARRANFLMIHVFPYSRRAGTEADRMPDQIPEPIKHARCAELTKLEGTIRSEILDGMIGKTVTVLFETFAEGSATGHTADFLEVRCQSEVPLHAICRDVLITGHDGTLCFGNLLPATEPQL